VVETGPGAPIGANMDEGEEWEQRRNVEPRYFPQQAKKGDAAIFFRKAAVEIKFDGKTYLIIPHGAILALIRNGKPVSGTEESD